MPFKKERFGTLQSGEKIDLYRLENSQGMTVDVITLGATIVSLKVPDRDGKLDDVVLGFDNPQQYMTDSPYFGAIVGRYGNRIANGRFKLDGETYTLAQNNGKNHLHGGDCGFDKKVWTLVNEVHDEQSSDHTITLSLNSPDGDGGYPGMLDVQVSYRLSEKENCLTVEYSATVKDKATIVNLTQHSYFNLAGHGSGSVKDHVLQIAADTFLETDEHLIPTGTFKDVQDTPMDFRNPHVIGERIDENFTSLRFGGGYDHNWVLKEETSQRKNPAAVLADPKSGRTMTVYTDEPGIQFYAANFLDSSIVGKNSTTYGRRHAVCLETQHFPDSPNQDSFPSTALRPGEVYRTATTFAFGIEIP